MSDGSGFGKTILFGEHFVVYGLPAVASAIGKKTIANVEKSDKFEFIDNRPETPGYKETKKDEIKRQLDAIIRHFNIDVQNNPIKIVLSGDLECASGIGASAALAASISRALNQHLGLGMDDDEINRAAYIVEEAGSGTPSGIDNTCAVHGGFITFEKNLSGGPNKIERLSLPRPVEVVIANTGITKETKEVVADVKKLKENSPEIFGRIFSDYRQIFSDAVVAIKNGNMKKLGILMDRNQQILAEMTLSCPEIEEIISAAKSAGAFGAKLTGTGRGGSVIVLTPWKDLQEKVAKAIEEKGHSVLKTSIG